MSAGNTQNITPTKLEVPEYLCGGPHNRDYNIFGSKSGSPYSGELSHLVDTWDPSSAGPQAHPRRLMPSEVWYFSI